MNVCIAIQNFADFMCFTKWLAELEIDQFVDSYAAKLDLALLVLSFRYARLCYQIVSFIAEILNLIINWN